eukprot:TRINITY_DN3697_c0_g1_i12.p1 TRINITY_DN3697_c0_g1~~TRINITY_DN3697_c0_g1_i12.p1  ORF type:complete len:151 (-),score=14.98 TRINITY_DN3697_c0_g1_i12:269-721(-)
MALKFDAMLADKGYVVMVVTMSEQIFLWNSMAQDLKCYHVKRSKTIPGLCSFLWPYLLLSGQTEFQILDVSNRMQVIHHSKNVQSMVLAKLVTVNMALVCMSNKVIFVEIPDQLSTFSMKGKSMECSLHTYDTDAISAITVLKPTSTLGT